MLGSAVLAAQALVLSGDEAACHRLLPAIAAGDQLAAVAWATPAGRWDPDEVAFSAAGTGRLTGEAHYVLDGQLAGTLLVAARGETGAGLYEVDARSPGVTRSAVPTMDLTRRLAIVGLDGVPGRRLGTGNPLGALRDLACVALSAEQIGAASRAFELTHDYVQQRVQFGRPIGSFQVLQHRLAEAYLRLEAATTASWTAAEAFVAGGARAATPAAMAKVHCSESLQAIAAEMVQMHGGLAITWEHDAHLYLRRAYADAQLFGAPATHLDRLAATLLA
jgi:alkylation response protein AidB-like acyl-CoA dehydrogenase